VHVVDTAESYIKAQGPSSYISLYSNTPGKLTREVETLKDEEFFCGRNKTIDFVTFSVNYGCWSYLDGQSGWTKSEIPTIQVESDSKTDVRETIVSIDTKSATRWALAINMEEVDDFRLYGSILELLYLHFWYRASVPAMLYSSGMPVPSKELIGTIVAKMHVFGFPISKC
jgi:hypothetical protein